MVQQSKIHKYKVNIWTNYMSDKLVINYTTDFA